MSARIDSAQNELNLISQRFHNICLRNAIDAYALTFYALDKHTIPSVRFVKSLVTLNNVFKFYYPTKRFGIINVCDLFGPEPAMNQRFLSDKHGPLERLSLPLRGELTIPIRARNYELIQSIVKLYPEDFIQALSEAGKILNTLEDIDDLIALSYRYVLNRQNDDGGQHFIGFDEATGEFALATIARNIWSIRRHILRYKSASTPSKRFDITIPNGKEILESHIDIPQHKGCLKDGTCNIILLHSALRVLELFKMGAGIDLSYLVWIVSYRALRAEKTLVYGLYETQNKCNINRDELVNDICGIGRKPTPILGRKVPIWAKRKLPIEHLQSIEWDLNDSETEYKNAVGSVNEGLKILAGLGLVELNKVGIFHTNKLFIEDAILSKRIYSFLSQYDNLNNVFPWSPSEFSAIRQEEHCNNIVCTKKNQTEEFNDDWNPL